MRVVSIFVSSFVSGHHRHLVFGTGTYLSVYVSKIRVCTRASNMYMSFTCVHGSRQLRRPGGVRISGRANESY